MLKPNTRSDFKERRDNMVFPTMKGMEETSKNTAVFIPSIPFLIILSLKLAKSMSKFLSAERGRKIAQ